MRCFNLTGKKLIALLIALAVGLWGAAGPVLADSPEADTAAKPLVYTVQPGDTLVLIALRHNLNPIEIALTNKLANPNLIFPGQELILPNAAAPPADEPAPNITHIVQPGETASGIAALYGVPLNHLLLLNQLDPPNWARPKFLESPGGNWGDTPPTPHPPKMSDTLPDSLQVGRVLKIPGGPPPEPGPLAAPFTTLELSEPTIIQGRTLVIRATLSAPATLGGNFEGWPLLFYPGPGGQQWAIAPVHALLKPDVYPIIITAALPDGQHVTRHINLTVIEGPYGTENIQLDGSRAALLEADLVQQERELLLNIWSQVSLRPRWAGPFWYPVAPDTLRITSYFGTRRQYNNSEELSFHGGADFGGGIGAPIYAPAAGTVMLARPLTVRGNAVVIDHGLGLFSNYWHQSQIVVTEGQEVQPGDLIGYIGDTGLVTGPHLHWELRLQGIAVNPLQWVQQSIP